MPRIIQSKLDDATLRMAIIGYQNELEKLSEKITAIKSQLGQRGPGRPKGTAVGTDHPAENKTGLSAAARARIAAAQTARWEAYRKSKSQAAATLAAKPKRRLSAAGRRAIIAATKKRWAAARAAKAAAA